MAEYKVTAGAVVVRVGGTERYLYRGATLPDGVSADDVKRLSGLGLIEQAGGSTRRRGSKTAKADSEQQTGDTAESTSDE